MRMSLTFKHLGGTGLYNKVRDIHNRDGNDELLIGDGKRYAAIKLKIVVFFQQLTDDLDLFELEHKASL